MSTKGPKKKAPVPPTMQVVSLDALLKNPNQYSNFVEPTLLLELTNSHKIANISKTFVALAMNQNTILRQAAMHSFFLENQDLISNALFKRFINEIERIYKSAPSKLGILEEVIISLETNEEALKKDQPENTEALKQLRSTITEKVNALANELVQRSGQINGWYELLQLSKDPECQRLLIAYAFAEINVVLYHLQILFMKGKISTDSYIIYQLLTEKFGWFVQLLEKYQAEVVEDLITRADENGFAIAFGTLQNCMLFHSVFSNLSIMKEIQSKAQRFCEAIVPRLSQEQITLYKITEYQNVLTNIIELMDTTNPHPWLATFKLLDGYLQNALTVSSSVDINDLIGKAKNLHERFQPKSNDRLAPNLLQSFISEFIEILTLKRAVEPKLLKQDNAKQFYLMSLQLQKLISIEPTLQQGYMGLCIQSAYQKVTFELKQQCLLAEPQKSPEPVQTETPAAVLKEPFFNKTDALESLSQQFATLTVDETTENQKEEEKKDKDVNEEEEKEEENRHREHKASLNEEHEATLKAKVAEQKQTHTVKIAELRAHHAMMITDLTEELTKKEVETLASLKKMQTEELAAEKSALLSQQQKFKDKKNKQLQRKSQQLTETHVTNMALLKAAHAEQMALLKSQHTENIKALEKNKAHHFNELQAQTTRNTAQLTQLGIKQQAELVVAAHVNRRATDGSAVIRTILVPTEIAYIMQDLADAGIEAYLTGGFVRDSLLNLPKSANSDFDIIVNCSPAELPTKLKRFAKSNIFQPCQYKMGKIDFWCEPWENLSESLKRRDFTINTFISDLNGHVYDLCGYQADISAQFLHLINKTESRFKDRSLMLRMLRFSIQLSKAIRAEDMAAIYNNASDITDCPWGIFLTNIRHLFSSEPALRHYHNLCVNRLLPFIFPGLTLPQYNTVVDSFMRHKLTLFSKSINEIDYYQVLALFLLPKVLNNPITSDKELRQQVEIGLKLFFTHYKGEVTEADKSKTLKSVTAFFLDATTVTNQLILGLYNEFKEYEAAVNALIQPMLPAYRHFQQVQPNAMAAAPNASATPTQGSFKP